MKHNDSESKTEGRPTRLSLLQAPSYPNTSQSGQFIKMKQRANMKTPFLIISLIFQRAPPLPSVHLDKSAKVSSIAAIDFFGLEKLLSFDASTSPRHDHTLKGIFLHKEQYKCEFGKIDNCLLNLLGSSSPMNNGKSLQLSHIAEHTQYMNYMYIFIFILYNNDNDNTSNNIK